MTLSTPTADEHVINYLHGHLGLRVGDAGGSAMAHLATLWEEHPQQVALSLDELAPWIPQLSAQSLGVAWRAISDRSLPRSPTHMIPSPDMIEAAAKWE